MKLVLKSHIYDTNAILLLLKAIVFFPRPFQVFKDENVKSLKLSKDLFEFSIFQKFCLGAEKDQKYFNLSEIIFEI